MKKIFATSVFAMAALSANAAPLVTIGDQLDIFFRGAVTGSWNSNVTYTGSSNKINDYAAIFRLGAEADYGRNSKFKANVKFFEDLTRYAQHKEFNSNLSHVTATASFTDQLLKIDANFSFDQRFQNTSTTIQNDALVRYDDYAAGINATYSFSEKLDGELGGMWQYTEYLGKWSTIYSDVDVMFKGDLSNLYGQNLTNYQIGAVAAERTDEINGIHQHFPAYKGNYIYFSGLIVFNNKKCKEDNIIERFFDNMKKYKEKLKMFDLEVMNLSCNKIKPLGFEYCVLENIYYGKYQQTQEYQFLKNVYSDAEIDAAIEKPIIVHYAGNIVKMWKKLKPEKDYFEYIKQSPYFGEYQIKQRKKKLLRCLNPIWYLLSRITPIKSYRKKFRNILRGNF